jgi:hypothetical protein
MMPVPGWDVPHDYYAPDEEPDLEADVEPLVASLVDAHARPGQPVWASLA